MNVQVYDQNVTSSNFSLCAAWVIFTTMFNQNEPQMCSLGKQFVNLEIFWIEKSVFSKWQVIKSLKKTYNDTLSFTKPTESQLNTIIIHKIKWFNNNICPSGSLIIQFRQWKIQPDQFLKILIQPVTKCVIKVSQSVVKCYTNIWIYKTIWSYSSYSWNWTGLLNFRKHHI